MSFTATISLTAAGANATSFNLYSNVDSYAVPFETNVPKASMLAGFVSSNVPNLTNICRVVANCGNSVDMPINDPYIFVYYRCNTSDYYYNIGLSSLKAEDNLARCYEYQDEGLLSVMTATYPGLTELTTLVSSNCNCV